MVHRGSQIKPQTNDAKHRAKRKERKEKEQYI